MPKYPHFGFLFLFPAILLGLVNCNSPSKITLTNTPPLQTTFTTSPIPTSTIKISSSTPDQAQPTPEPLPLSAPGTFDTGYRNIDYMDPSRANRPVSLKIYYPAVLPPDSTATWSIRNAEPERSGAPYPLILSSAKVANIFGTHMASHGFIVASVLDQDSADLWGDWLIDYPLDMIFTLNQVASQPPAELQGMVDANKTGVMGYSFDAYTSLALSGARVDPQFYQDQCAKASSIQAALETWWITYICEPAKDWAAFAAHADSIFTTSSDGLWQPMTDPRIRAAMPMAPEGAWLFGPKGLQAVDKPVFIIGAAEDTINYYYLEAAPIFEQLGSPQKVMITFLGLGHMMIYDTEPVNRMKHFAAAFFGYHLQGKAELADFFSQNFVQSYPDLAWGVLPATQP